MVLVNSHIDGKHSFNSKLYEPLTGGKSDMVMNLCRQIPEGPLYILTIHNGRVLQMAIYSKQKDLVGELLEKLPNDHIEDMILQEDSGNTILHEAATSNGMVLAAEETLRKAPKLLDMRNRRGGTARFQAARYGQMEIFEFLDGEVDKIFGTSESEEEVEQVKQCFSPERC